MSKSKLVAVEFQAELRQIKSLVDRSFNITINLPENCLEQAKEMMGHLNELVNIVLVFTDKPDSRN